MQKTRIDWGIPNLYTWNPASGCLRNCSFDKKPYCYARRIHDRFSKSGTPFSNIVYHLDRLTEPMTLKKPSTIFVGSMSDIAFWGESFIRDVLNRCNLYYKHTFMFLTKSPNFYRKFDFPKNCRLGLTLTEIDCPEMQEYAEKHAQEPNAYLSLEPLLGEVSYPLPNEIGRVIVGAMTGPGAVPVKPEWIASIKENVPEHKIFWKPSIDRKLI